MKSVKVHTLLARCLDRMPGHYPRPHLVIHESPESMVGFLRRGRYAFHRGLDPSVVIGTADAIRNTIHLPLETVRGKRKILLRTLLHEIGHLYAAQRYGADSDEYMDERRANTFELRWFRRLKGTVLPGKVEV